MTLIIKKYENGLKFKFKDEKFSSVKKCDKFYKDWEKKTHVIFLSSNVIMFSQNKILAQCNNNNNKNKM